MNERDLERWDDGIEGDADDVARAFQEIVDVLHDQTNNIAIQLATIDTSLAHATTTLGGLIQSEYADELTKLRDSVTHLMDAQTAIQKHVQEQGIALGSFRYDAADFQHRLSLFAAEVSCLNDIRYKLDRIIKRPASVAQQRRRFLWSFAGGFAAGLVFMIFGLAALPDRAEAAVARVIMGTTYAQAGWDMFYEHSPSDYNRLAVLTWVDGRNGKLEKLIACRDRAWRTGEPQYCTVVFKPKSE